MGMPKVNIIIRNGGLTTQAGTDDQVCGLILQSPVAPAGLALATPAQIFSVSDAIALGITAAFDTANSTNCFKQINDFYATAGQGKELWIMILVNTTLMTTLLDVTQTTMAYALINGANGRIKMLGVSRKPAGSYTATYTGQLDADVANALPKAQALGDAFAALYKPFRVLIDGRDFQGTLSSLTNLRASAYNRVAVVLGADTVSTKESMVGRVLGRFAAGPVQRNIGRVKDGDIGITSAFFNGTTLLTDIKDIASASLDNVNDLGYIFPRKIVGLNGYYFNDDPTAAPIGDDFGQVARGRIIDKATVVAYTTYVTELSDDIDVDSTGKIAPGVAKYYQGKIETALRNAFFGGTFGAEVSDIKVVVDPNQNIITTNKIVVTVYIQPKAYSKTIEVSLGLTAVTG
jgi:hypothetical protein